VRAGKVDHTRYFAVIEVESRAELARKRTHRFVVCAGGDAQPPVAGALCFGEQRLEQHAADAAAAQVMLDAEGDLGGAIGGAFWRVQLGGRVHLAVLKVADNDDAIVQTADGISDDEVLIDRAVEAIAPAPRIEPQQVVAQKRQFGGLQHPDFSLRQGARARQNLGHSQTPRG